MKKIFKEVEKIHFYKDPECKGDAYVMKGAGNNVFIYEPEKTYEGKTIEFVSNTHKISDPQTSSKIIKIDFNYFKENNILKIHAKEFLNENLIFQEKSKIEMQVIGNSEENNN